jgi:hypothetical protein
MSRWSLWFGMRVPGHGTLELERIQGFVAKNAFELEQPSEPANSP